MIPPPFEYLSPNQLSEAISLLQKHGENAKILAGGHSLIPAMKLRFALPEYLIDIGGIECQVNPWKSLHIPQWPPQVTPKILKI